MILYFTGTGNSRKCAGWLGAKLGEEWVDIVPTMKKGEYGAFQSETPWVFVCPTYGWQAPRVFVDFLRRSRFEGSRQAYFVLTCGGEIGNAGESLRTLCQEKGWEYKGAAGVVIDGAFRDLEGCEEAGFPVFARALTCGTAQKTGEGQINVPVSCAGVAVNPGDFIVGDVNGVCVIPRDQAETVLERAAKKVAAQKRTAEEMERTGKAITRIRMDQ